jgi:hypothetical protein
VTILSGAKWKSLSIGGSSLKVDSYLYPNPGRQTPGWSMTILRHIHHKTWPVARTDWRLTILHLKIFQTSTFRKLVPVPLSRVRDGVSLLYSAHYKELVLINGREKRVRRIKKFPPFTSYDVNGNNSRNVVVWTIDNFKMIAVVTRGVDKSLVL